MDWWDWVILVAGVIAALGVVLHEVRRIRDKPRVRWGSQVVDILGPRAFIRNMGDVDSSSVIAVLNGCVPERGESMRDLGKVAVDEAKEIRLESFEETAWAMIIYADPVSPRKNVLTWIPIGNDEDLLEEHKMQSLRNWWQALFARIKFGFAVGPGGRLRCSLPRDPRGLASSLQRVQGQVAKKVKRAERIEKREAKSS